MDQALVQDVVSEVMKRLGNRTGAATRSDRAPASPWPRRDGGVRAGEDAPANEPKAREAEAHPHRVSAPTGSFGIFSSVDDCVNAATESQKKLVQLKLEDRDAIVKLVKQLAKNNAQSWGRMEMEETKIGRLDHKIEKLQ